MLNLKQELLLSRYCDGELTFVGEFFANKLINNNSLANEFYNNLLEQKKLFLELEPKQKTNLADKVLNRISQEERAKLYLGERKLHNKKEFNWQLGFAGALGAGALAAITLAIIPVSENTTKQIANSTQAIPITSRIQMVRSNNIGLNAPPVEVEWIKSDGRVKMLRTNNHRELPIIWIKPKNLSNDPIIIEPLQELNYPKAITVNNLK